MTFLLERKLSCQKKCCRRWLTEQNEIPENEIGHNCFSCGDNRTVTWSLKRSIHIACMLEKTFFFVISPRMHSDRQGNLFCVCVCVSPVAPTQTVSMQAVSDLGWNWIWASWDTEVQETCFFFLLLFCDTTGNSSISFQWDTLSHSFILTKPAFEIKWRIANLWVSLEEPWRTEMVLNNNLHGRQSILWHSYNPSSVWASQNTTSIHTELDLNIRKESSSQKFISWCVLSFFVRIFVVSWNAEIIIWTPISTFSTAWAFWKQSQKWHTDWLQLHTNNTCGQAIE